MACVTYNLKAEFLSEPTEVNELNEVVKSVDSDWAVIDRAYCKVHTGNGREVYRARQTHAEVNAVVEMAWQHWIGDIDADNRIRVYKPDNTYTIFDIVHAEDVDFANEVVKFACKARVT